MDLGKEIDTLIRARFTLLVVVSLDEEQVVRELKGMCEQAGRKLVLWDHADYFTTVAGLGKPDAAKDPITALEAIEKDTGDTLYVLRDFHQCWDNQPRVIRKLRNVVQMLKFTRKSIVITTHSAVIPEELRDDGVIIEPSPPNFEDLSAILDRLSKTPGVKVELSPAERTHIVSLALGLSTAQAQRVFSKAIVTDGMLNADDINLIAEEKRQIIRGSGALEYFTATETISDVGGLEKIKAWLKLRAVAFSRDARAYGLPPPKGMALIGVPGTGKSLTAKMIGSLWRLPLIRLDVGALFGSLVGESEENTRRALHLVEAVAPCVLWIDEMEKALSVGDGDGGTGMRVLGKMLTWMQDKKKPVFIVATANNVERLPPELLRRGRFDEVFFLDLPNMSERQAIFTVHLKKRGRDPARFDVAALAAASESYVGAEIEQAIIDAMYAAFSDQAKPKREFTTADIHAALARLVPLSRSQRERIEYLRAWVVEGRAQSASVEDLAPSADGNVPLQL